MLCYAMYYIIASSDLDSANIYTLSRSLANLSALLNCIKSQTGAVSKREQSKNQVPKK